MRTRAVSVTGPASVKHTSEYILSAVIGAVAWLPDVPAAEKFGPVTAQLFTALAAQLMVDV